jgi:hypothetical protein
MPSHRTLEVLPHQRLAPVLRPIGKHDRRLGSIPGAHGRRLLHCAERDTYRAINPRRLCRVPRPIEAGSRSRRDGNLQTRLIWFEQIVCPKFDRLNRIKFEREGEN